MNLLNDYHIKIPLLLLTRSHHYTGHLIFIYSLALLPVLPVYDRNEEVQVEHGRVEDLKGNINTKLVVNFWLSFFFFGNA